MNPEDFSFFGVIKKGVISSENRSTRIRAVTRSRSVGSGYRLQRLISSVSFVYVCFRCSVRLPVNFCRCPVRLKNKDPRAGAAGSSKTGGRLGRPKNGLRIRAAAAAGRSSRASDLQAAGSSRALDLIIKGRAGCSFQDRGGCWI